MSYNADFEERKVTYFGILGEFYKYYRVCMKNFFQPNIDRRGRLSRAIMGVSCLIAGVIISSQMKWWVGLILVGAGLFAIFEAISKWCIVRACGIKTKL